MKTAMPISCFCCTSVALYHHDSKGISLELDGKNGEHQIIKYPWKNVAKAVKKAVSEGWYISEADRESRAKSAILDAKRISIHYESPSWYDNSNIERVRQELKACGIDYDTRITGKMFAVYASEALRTIPEVKEKYLLIDRSGITVKVYAYDFSEAEEAAKSVAETPEYKAFAEACRSASSVL